MPATLASLRVRNLALVESLDWDLAPGFTAVTGETGSGKSIIIGALKLILGERADRTVVRSGADACSVEAVFALDDPDATDAALAEMGVDPCAGGELVVKRVVSAAGQGRQFLNCCPTTLAALRQITSPLVDLHGPHDHQSLFAPESQLALLDAYAGATRDRAACAEIFKAAERLRAERDTLAADDAALEREADLLAHQTREIDAAQLAPGEEEEILARYRVASNGRRLAELASGIVAGLADADDAAIPRLHGAVRAMRELARLDPSREPAAASFVAAVEHLSETADDLRAYLGDLEIDPAELARLEQRVSLVESLKRKYGSSLAEVIAFGEKAAQRLAKIASRGSELERLDAAIDAESARLAAAAAKLSDKRRKAAPRLAKEIGNGLRDLGFLRAGFDVRLGPLASPGRHGAESAEFLFAPNPGEPEQPLRAIASSGEISRVMLALKSVLADQDEVPLLVFDEIDANVGGEIAHAVADRMRDLGRRHQVLCITHLPQVAAAASSHFVVSKRFANERTTSSLDPVAGEARTREVARMLGGRGDSAVAHARALLAPP